jgi:hypothetical protein
MPAASAQIIDNGDSAQITMTNSGPHSITYTDGTTTVTADKFVLLRDRKPGSTNSAVDPIIDDILRDHLAMDRNDLSFSLDDKSFVVNGLPQPAEITDRFRKKYVVGQKDSYSYLRKEHSISTSVTTDH